MSLKGYIDDKCQEAVLNAVNYTSSVVQNQTQASQIQTGLMTIVSIKGSILQVLDGSQSYQTIQYIGSDYIQPGQSIFCSNGFAQ